MCSSTFRSRGSRLSVGAVIAGCLSAAVALCAPGTAAAHPMATSGVLDYYVSPSGSDSTGDGSAQYPWASMGKAASSVSLGSAGTVVHVAPGTYTSITDNTQSGAPGAYLTFQSDTPWAAQLRTGGGLADFPFRNDGSYVRIVGFDVTSTGASEGIVSYGQYNVIAGNHVHDITPKCTSHGGDGIGDDESASDNTIVGNVVNNIVRDNAMFGINVHSDANGADNQYRDNLFYDNGKGDYGLDNSRTTPPWTPPNSSGTLDADPLLVNYQTDGSGDYHLTAASPCVDAGTTLGAPGVDYDGTPRPQGNGIDIGPYEYH